MKKLDLATLGTVAGGTICAPVCCPPGLPAAPVPPGSDLRQRQVQEVLIAPAAA